jgi:hypothetical protein
MGGDCDDPTMRAKKGRLKLVIIENVLALQEMFNPMEGLAKQGKRLFDYRDSWIYSILVSESFG